MNLIKLKQLNLNISIDKIFHLTPSSEYGKVNTKSDILHTSNDDVSDVEAGSKGNKVSFLSYDFQKL